MSFEIFIDIISSRSHYGLGVDSASNRNEYQEHFLGVKAGHVARMGEERGVLGYWWGNRRQRDYWGDLGVDGWIISVWISRRLDVGIWTGLGWRTLVSAVMNFRVP